jgi:protein FAM50
MKKRKKAAKKILSFDDHENEDAPRVRTNTTTSLKATTPTISTAEAAEISRRLTPNPNSALPAVKAKTKASLAAEAIERERLRKEFLEMQERVRNTDVAVPFVFYDGSNIPGGVVKVKKGDRIWLILERSRKVGAETGVGGTGANAGMATHRSQDENKRAWARIGVDDLLLLRGKAIVPHHYELYHFIANQTIGPDGNKLFDYAATVQAGAEESLIRVPGKEKLEGHDHDPDFTKVVDRRWYEKNKHIYPASTWKEYKAGEMDSSGGKTDLEGNAFFFS